MVKAAPFAVSTLSIPAAKYAVFSKFLRFAFNACNMANPAAMAEVSDKVPLDKLDPGGAK
jgi:hypothetical protein